MRRLNESASWLSDVSDLSDRCPQSTESRTAPEEGCPPPMEAGIDCGRVFLAEMINESATWIDADISESDRDEPMQQPFTLMAPIACRACVGRSFSY